MKPHPTAIGAFILVAIALGVAGVILFSSSQLWATRELFIAYFDQSVSGLQPGSAVKFRGVSIGQVKDILIQYNQAEGDTAIPVLIEINHDLIKAKTGGTVDLATPRSFQTAVTNGLRAKLETESFVTGRLYVDLDIMPEAPPPEFHQRPPVYKEIPTAPTQIAQLMRNLAELDIKSLENQVSEVLSNLNRTLDALETAAISRGVTNLLESLNRLAASPDIPDTIEQVKQTLAEGRRLIGQVRTNIGPLTDHLEAGLQEARVTLQEGREALRDARQALGPHAPLRRELTDALDALSEAARAMADLAEFLKRHPNALITGRKTPEAPRP